MRHPLLCAAVLAGLCCLQAPAQEQTSKLSPDLARRAASAPGGELLPVFIVLSQQPSGGGLRVSTDREIRPMQDRLLASLQAGGSQRTGAYSVINMVTAEVPAAMLPTLEQNPDVSLVFPVRTRSSADLSLSVPAMGVPAYWTASGRTGTGATIALVDTGVRTDHPAFAGRTIVDRTFLTFGSQNPCFDDDATSARDRQGHGTHIAGILMSQGSAGYLDYYGVARGLSTLYNVKTAYKVKAPCNTNSNGEIDDRDLIAALEWAATSTPSRIISFSFGGPAQGDGDDPFTKVVDYISDVYDSFIAVAAGNTGPGISTVTSPAIGYNVTSVANWNFRAGRTISNTSSRGPTIGARFKPDIAAPGVDITSTNINWDASPSTADDYTTKSGTSMAAPHVAGAAALLASSGVTDPLQIKAILLNTTGDLVWLTDRGWGFVNMAVAQAQTGFRDSALLQAGSYQLYRVNPGGAAQGGPLHATLTWNRHLDGPQFTRRFNNLDLFAYQRTTGALVASSATVIQNVEKIQVAATEEDLVVKVDTASPNPSLEFYGIAMSRTFTRASAPVLTATCNPPASAFTGVAFAVACTVSNRGDLPAFNVNVAGTNAGTIAAGATVTVSPSFTGTALGTGAFTAEFASISYGESFITSVSFTVPLVAPPPPPAAAPNVTAPLNAATVVALSETLTWTPVAGATSYDVYLGATNPPPFLISTANLSVTPPLFGSVRYFWRVVARNAGGAGPSSPLWSFTTAASSGLRFVPLTSPCRLFDSQSEDSAILEAEETREVRLAGNSCLPAGAETAAAYSLRVSVFPEEALGYLNIWPAEQEQPVTALLGALDGNPRTNSVLLSGSAARVFVTNRAHVAIDINGYFTGAADAEGLAYYPMATPCRAGSPSCSVPPIAGAYAVNTDSNFAIVREVPADAGLYGYFAPPGNVGGLTFRPAAAPCRIVDTRLTAAGALGANVTRNLTTSQECGTIPRGAVAVVNVTAVPLEQRADTQDPLTLWQTGVPKPPVSTLIVRDGAITSNAAFVAAPFSAAATLGGVHFILDWYGLFLP